MEKCMLYLGLQHQMSNNTSLPGYRTPAADITLMMLSWVLEQSAVSSMSLLLNMHQHQYCTDKIRL